MLNELDRAVVTVRVTSRLARSAKDRVEQLRRELADAQDNLSLAVDVAEEARNELTRLAEEFPEGTGIRQELRFLADARIEANA